MTEARAESLSELLDIDLEEIADQCLGGNWQRIGIYFQKTHSGFTIKYKEIQSKHPTGTPDDILLRDMFYKLAEQGITIEELASALEDSRIGLGSLAKILRTTPFTNKNKLQPRADTKPISSPARINTDQTARATGDLLQAPFRQTSTEEYCVKVLLVPSDDELSSTLDNMLKSFGLQQLHDCKTHVVWVNSKKTAYEMLRYVIKFLVGDRASLFSINDALQHVSEVLFLLRNQHEEAKWLTVEEFDTGDLLSDDVRFCFQILFETLKETLKSAIPHRVYGVCKQSLDSLKYDAKLAHWFYDTTRKTTKRFYCCVKLEEVDRELRDVGNTTQSAVMQCTSIPTRKEATSFSSINVYLSSSLVLPIMLKLHKRDIADALKKKGLTVRSIHEACIQDVIEALANPKNKDCQVELEAMIERMERDQVPYSAESAKLKIEFNHARSLKLKIMEELPHNEGPIDEGQARAHPTPRKNNNNALGPAQQPEVKEPDFTKEEWYDKENPINHSVPKKGFTKFPKVRVAIAEDEYLANLPGTAVTEMANEIGYKDGWKDIGLHFQPEVKYEILTKQYPHLMFNGDIAYCKVMIDEIAKQNVTMGQFLKVVDEVGLKSSAHNFRQKYVRKQGLARSHPPPQNINVGRGAIAKAGVIFHTYK